MRNPRDLPTSLDLLRGFEAAARALSFTGAAAELHVTQSAISRQVQQLEEQLGVKLFERRTRALALTDVGAIYFAEVARALQQLREATAAARAPAHAIVRVTTTITFASLWLVPRLATFQARHPDIAVHIMADNAVRDLQRSAVDLAIRYIAEGPATGDAVRLFGEHVVPVCSPDFLTRHPIRSLQDIVQLPLLDFEDMEARSPWLSWRVWLEAMKLPPPARRGARFSLHDQAIQAAVAGQGLALGRIPLINRMLDDHRLVMPLRGVRYQTAAQNRAYWLIAAPSAQQRSEVATFAGWLRRQAAAAGRRNTRLR